MSAIKFRTLLRRDAQVARLIIEQAGVPVTDVQLDAAALDQAIIALGNTRAALSERVPDTREPSNKIKALTNYRWRGLNQKAFGRRILAWHHPGFGWIAFAMSDEDARALAKWLLSDLPDPSAAGAAGSA